MEVLNEATVAAAGVVLFVTQALKYVPVQFTTRYSVWVNIILSFIGAVVVDGIPTFGGDLWPFVVKWLVIAVTAAIAYNHLLSKAVVQPAS